MMTPENLSINTRLRIFQNTIVPFGIVSAPALFQKIMDTLLQGVPNTLCYLDDILITGKQMQNTHATLKEF